jgi:hypothetical protein
MMTPSSRSCQNFQLIWREKTRVLLATLTYFALAQLQGHYRCLRNVHVIHDKMYLLLMQQQTINIIYLMQ